MMLFIDLLLGFIFYFFIIKLLNKLALKYPHKLGIMSKREDSIYKYLTSKDKAELRAFFDENNFLILTPIILFEPLMIVVSLLLIFGSMTILTNIFNFDLTANMYVTTIIILICLFFYNRHLKTMILSTFFKFYNDKTYALKK